MLTRSLRQVSASEEEHTGLSFSKDSAGPGPSVWHPASSVSSPVQDGELGLEMPLSGGMTTVASCTCQLLTCGLCSFLSSSRKL